MGHFVEFVMEVLFSFLKITPEKMPDDIIYKPCFLIKHSVKNIISKVIESLVIIIPFVLLWIFVKADILFIIAVILGVILLLFTFIGFSFRCSVTEEHMKMRYCLVFCKYIKWNDVCCIRVIEKTDEEHVIIAIYNNDGKCVIDLNTEMDNTWYVVKMAEQKNIWIKYEKDLSIKQMSRL